MSGKRERNVGGNKKAEGQRSLSKGERVTGAYQRWCTRRCDSHWCEPGRSHLCFGKPAAASQLSHGLCSHSTTCTEKRRTHGRGQTVEWMDDQTACEGMKHRQEEETCESRRAAACTHKSKTYGQLNMHRSHDIDHILHIASWQSHSKEGKCYKDRNSLPNWSRQFEQQ